MVFDLDGVLVDSEGLAWDAWRTVLAPWGIEVTADDIAAVTGRSFGDGYTHFADRGLPSEQEIARHLNETTGRLFEAYLEAFDDAFDTVEALHLRGVPMAVASSSSRRRLDISLRAAGLEGWLPITAAGDEVDHGKPAPDVYLLAAERLGEDPSSCVAVEDTQIGVASARAAGMFVVAVQRGDVTLQADVVIPRLTPAAVLHES